MPALFVSHGAPTTALQTGGAFARALRSFAARTPRPRAIAMVSAHWESRVPQATGSAAPTLIYDFGGFAPELYQIRYPCPGAPDLARRIAALVPGTVIDERRGLDHGAWTPLRLMYPEADLPVVQVALAGDPRALGRALAPLRDEGVLLIGSGGAVHNLRRVDLSSEDAPVQPWAREFDDWLGKSVSALNVDLSQAPGAQLAAPTPEHFDPLLVVIATAQPGERAVPVYQGFQYATLSMRSFAIE
jgi:4,5-DOPA dioxygenase extradiol